MRLAKMRKFVLIVSRFSPAFAGAIKSAIGARKGKFKIPNIGSRRQRTPGTKPARAARFKNGNFFRPLAEFFNFPKNGIDAHLSLFLSFISHAELLAPHPRPAKSRADFYGQRKAPPHITPVARTTVPNASTATHIPHASTPTTHYACFVFSRALHPRGALFLLYKQPFFNNE